MSLKPVFVIILLRLLSNRNMNEVAQYLSNEGGRKSKKSGFNIKLIDNNELIGKLFIGDKFPLLLEVNENKEVSNLLPTIFLDN